MLYLIATPIGHLGDLTFRAVETIKLCSYLLCEDTRHSRTLLKHYEIILPLHSYHKFNEAKKENEIIQDLKNGKTIGLISDAGTPGIADPGERLVKRCREENIPIFVLPGPCAAIVALTSSGLATEPFQFVGFLPKENGPLKKQLPFLLSYPGVTIAYESPHRIDRTLKLLAKTSPKRKLSIARELTKLHEEVLIGTAEELLQAHTTWKGELILLIDGEKELSFPDSPKEHVESLMQTYDLSKQESIKIVAKLRSLPKRDLYKEMI